MQYVPHTRVSHYAIMHTTCSVWHLDANSYLASQSAYSPTSLFPTGWLGYGRPVIELISFSKHRPAPTGIVQLPRCVSMTRSIRSNTSSRRCRSLSPKLITSKSSYIDSRGIEGIFGTGKLCLFPPLSCNSVIHPSVRVDRRQGISLVSRSR